MANVLIPLPSRDSDPSEVAVSWQTLRSDGHVVVFATSDGQPAHSDELMLSGIGLDPWGWLPGLRRLRVVGLVLRANGDARKAYAAMQNDIAFGSPRRWDELHANDFDGLLLPGGHRARGMREYLESPVLQQLAVAFFDAGKPVAAICHGVLLAARSRSPKTGKSVLFGRRTTALTWAFEKKAWMTTRITRFWDPHYYRTYNEATDQTDGYMSVQQEVTRALADPADFRDVPPDVKDYARKTNGIARDSATDDSPAFVVRDGNYLSARWPGDVHRFAREFSAMLAEAKT
ncbi:putative intracellular protease/amidase [Rhodanobacter sp. ANJX3]|uniref:type 1 glutamine amidotransferase domain-containing protein n=1 Tax=Rhodanobacter sp. ANJX3 TaxID=2723083 RepID=UPI00160DD145|nr:type 1 glutamine amidotransferase domain-containing protein [Rhodanobacter sp. ANJX3]MBB5359496.1 putative intracellular protease/amidase [Rhodanobacter sp. ANJX3]